MSKISRRSLLAMLPAASVARALSGRAVPPATGARKTWDDDSRRIELGEGPTLVRLSTENGPVSVKIN